MITCPVKGLTLLIALMLIACILNIIYFIGLISLTIIRDKPDDDALIISYVLTQPFNSNFVNGNIRKLIDVVNKLFNL